MQARENSPERQNRIDETRDDHPDWSEQEINKYVNRNYPHLSTDHWDVIDHVLNGNGYLETYRDEHITLHNYAEDDENNFTTIIDAVTLKTYNGANRHFIAYYYEVGDQEHPDGWWDFNEISEITDVNYVQEITEEYDILEGDE